MESKWREGTLADIAEVLMGQSPPGGDCSKELIGPPLLNGPTEFGSHYPAATQYTRNPKRMSKNGDLLFCVRGSTTGRMNWADREYALGRGLAAIRHHDPECQQYLRGAIDCRLDDLLSVATGSTFPNVSRNQILGIELNIPPLPEQKAIAHILGSLDDKIELNRRMNATLEGMAQALFKSWFVDFDPVIDNALAAGNPIPDELAPRAEVRRQALANGTANRDAAKAFPAAFQETESMGWIPEGWEVKRADEIADLSIGKTPPRKESHWFSNDSDGNVTWVSIRDMGSCGAFIGDSNEYLTPESVDKFNVKVIPGGSVLLSFKLTVGRVSITQNQMATNEAIAHFVNPKFGLMKEFVYSYLKAFDFSNLGSTSSIATAVNSKIIKSMPFLVPKCEVLECFEEAAGHWFNAISINIVQTNNLTKIRDTLLPNLISGELRITEVEQLTEEVLS